MMKQNNEDVHITLCTGKEQSAANCGDDDDDDDVQPCNTGIYLLIKSVIFTGYYFQDDDDVKTWEYNRSNRQ